MNEFRVKNHLSFQIQALELMENLKKNPTLQTISHMEIKFNLIWMN